MLIEGSKIFEFIRSSFLFFELNDYELWQIVEKFQTIKLSRGECLYNGNDHAECLYFVYQGKISLRKTTMGRNEPFAELIPGDFFGEEFLFDKVTGQNAFAMTEVIILRVKKEEILYYFSENLLPYKLFKITAQSRRKVMAKIPRWLSPDESIYFLTRRHIFFLGLKMLIPTFIFSGFSILVAWGVVTNEAELIYSSLIGIIFSILLAVWIWLEWRNDVFVVTSKRVLVSEKVILLHESRQEAPLNSILSTMYQSFQPLRLFIDYGTVRVNTYTGSLLLKRISSPNYMIYFIQGLQARLKEIVSQDDNLEMEAMIRQRLGIGDGSANSNYLIQDLPVRGSSKFINKNESIRNTKMDKDGDINSITYRKHWLILIRKIWIPTLALIFLWVIAFFLWEYSYLNMVTSGIWLFLLLITIGFWIYQYIDWQNDIYILTSEQILDIERKPLGRENKKTAELDNVLSLEHSRVGILGLMFNYGTVTINVGIEKFTFDFVSNPAQVQNEIFNRITKLREREEMFKSAKERERMANWLAIYHTHSGVSSN